MLVETTYILTAEMDPESYAWLDRLRQQHFPLERNLLPAHLTMFHRLSSAQAARRSRTHPAGCAHPAGLGCRDPDPVTAACGLGALPRAWFQK